jgi:precorrin-3B C17-methyltransferase
MGLLYVVGLGPGKKEGMTIEAKAALDASDVIAGYTAYVDLVKGTYPDKDYIVTPMRQEVDRCKAALEAAAGAQTVAMICSGDAGIYGMAGLIYEMLEDYPDVDVEVVPGITAAISGAAVLGAPLMNDFCVISLSDLMTPWDVIEKRLEGAGLGDFVVALYNPMSHKRRDHLQKACDILLKYRDKNTVCGWVQNIGRDGCNSKVLTLGELRTEEVDMFTTVIIGNSQTKLVRGQMVTARGYSK